MPFPGSEGLAYIYTILALRKGDNKQEANARWLSPEEATARRLGQYVGSTSQMTTTRETTFDYTLCSAGVMYNVRMHGAATSVWHALKDGHFKGCGPRAADWRAVLCFPETHPGLREPHRQQIRTAKLINFTSKSDSTIYNDKP